MKKIGIIGGLSPQSTREYYKWLDDGAEKRLGKGHTAPLIISSVDFGLYSAP